MKMAPYQIGRKRRKPHVDRMIPLINVVFLLLAFFILAGTFSAVDLSNIALPGADIKAPSEKDGLRLILLSNGTVGLEGEVYNSQELKALSSSIKDHPIILYADGGLVMEKLRPVWKKLELLGASEINLVLRQSVGAR
ncbi:hypothetical protein GUA87_03525 [Sneathiella sp. P13V-1]|uniref:ExbD/TolR family protein n=1 Tax=Sneathiella sp. P13V-1 TaxID=2697366 RepID=UPI00187BC2EC|nr:biopolymer transporter ExbD [Sneathiella sp. P13V-1]MBE7635899.1 hypothetical protein [Sneathiella sp. P13V-1]